MEPQSNATAISRAKDYVFYVVRHLENNLALSFKKSQCTNNSDSIIRILLVVVPTMSELELLFHGIHTTS